METIAILWLMFKEWLAKVFGSGINFDSPGYYEGDEADATEDEK
jgi:hypothetical protein